MKRGAEFQLTKDGSDDREKEVADDSNTAQGFQKASESELATRKIKPLPTRLGRTGTPKPAFSAPSPANPFLAASTSSPSPSTSTTAPTSAPSSFFKLSDKGHDAVAALTPPPSSFATPPATLPAFGIATNTSKAFASILNTSSTNSFTNPVSNASTPNGIGESTLSKYYTSLRGLNVSLLDFIQNSVESDPFSDLTSVLESYRTHRSKIQKECDEVPGKDKATSSASVPPSSSPFGGFGSSNTPKTSGSTFGFNPSTNAFSKPAEPEGSAITATTTNIFGPPLSSFGNFSKLPSLSATTTTTPSMSSDTVFGAPKLSSTDKASTASETPSVFGSSTSSFQPTKLPFSFGSSSSTVPNPFSSPSTNLFGSSASSSTLAFGSSADNSSPDSKPAPSIPFGSPSSVAKNAGVFYGFGSGSQSSTRPTSATAFQVGSRETTTEDGAAETGSEGTEPKESLPGLLTPNPHDEEGAGEENEETVHSVKLKAYRMRKAGEQGGSGWAELGMGFLRLKKDKGTGARRVLLRNSINGKISINFSIYTGLKPSISKKALTFVGHSDGVSQTYCVRLPSEEQANELKAALEREIEFVKAKESL